MIVLGIESSCDETAAAVYDTSKGLLASVVRSQIADHAPYGGVIPELAARKHLEAIIPVTREALQQAGLSLAEIDGIAATYTPGLVGALLVGLSFAKALAWSLHRPFIGVHHLEGHLLSPFLDTAVTAPSFPFIALIVSGGHTSLYKVSDFGSYHLLGKTVDDAAGEALDKAGKLLGLPYPGGMAIDTLTREAGNRNAYDFPIGLNQRDNLNFSFSGLKTSLVYRLKKMGLVPRSGMVPPIDPPLLQDLAASYQEAVVSALIRKSSFALQETGLADLVITGGVASNHRLRERLVKKAEKEGIRITFPDKAYCTDNAAMIAFAGTLRLKAGQRHDLSLNAVSRLPLESI